MAFAVKKQGLSLALGVAGGQEGGISVSDSELDSELEDLGVAGVAGVQEMEQRLEH